MLQATPPLPPAEPVATVRIEAVRGVPRFVAPEAVASGSVLRVVNRTDPRRVGPHTFSLVLPGALPRTPAARRACFAPDRICRAVADWHGVRGNGPPARFLARAGLPGWDTEGSVDRRGDSWFSGERPGASIEQPLAVDVSKAAKRIYFFCAIHPYMQGKIDVIPP